MIWKANSNSRGENGLNCMRSINLLDRIFILDYYERNLVAKVMRKKLDDHLNKSFINRFHQKSLRW